jgi:NADPH:quinone reductase-like Zn-dependent oxidoreductase
MVKAIVQDVYGSADVLELREITRPEPRDGELLIVCGRRASTRVCGT